jgi:hypothetical protein
VIGWNGQAVFINSKLFDTLGTLKKALEDKDLAAIGVQLDFLAAVEDDLNTQIVDIGSR